MDSPVFLANFDLSKIRVVREILIRSLQILREKNRFAMDYVDKSTQSGRKLLRMHRNALRFLRKLNGLRNEEFVDPIIARNISELIISNYNFLHYIRIL